MKIYIQRGLTDTILTGLLFKRAIKKVDIKEEKGSK